MQSTPEMKSPSRLVDLIRTIPEGAKNSYFSFRSDYSTARWGYKKVSDLSLRFSSLLEDHGIGRGDRVVIWGDNTLPLLVAFLGVLNRGAVLVPLDGTITRDTALLIIKKVRARLVVSSNNNGKVSGDTPFVDLETLEERLDGYPVKPFDNLPVYESDLAEIVFTSGTTAEPKGVMIRHGNITSLFPPILEAINRVRPVIRALRNINFLALLPLSHLYGQMAEIFVPLMVKGSVIFPKKLSPSFILETIKRDKINIAVAVPRILEIIRVHIINDIHRRGEETSIKDLEDILSGKEVREKEISMPHFGNYPVFTLLRFASWHIILFPFLRIFCRHKVKGIENLQGLNPPVIFIANHSSHVDTPLILRVLPHRFRCCLSPAMGTDLFREYFFPSGDHSCSRLFQFVGYMALVIFVHVYPFTPASFRKSFAYTGRLIEKNYCPLIFPEGRRTKTGETGRFMEGIGHLALGIRVPVVPLRLRGTFDILPPDASFPKRGAASVHIGKPYLVKGGDPETVTDELKRITEKL